MILDERKLFLNFIVNLESKSIKSVFRSNILCKGYKISQIY